MIKIPKDTILYVRRESSKRFRDDFRKIIEPRFLELKRQMIAEFLDHPITVEIKAGASASNTSGTLGGYGNLFTFIGFQEESDPIQPILDLLEFTRLINNGVALDGTMNYRVIMPTSQDIFDVTDMPWAKGRSWAKGIEIGISGLGHYMNTKGGRSSGGVQSKKKIENRPTPAGEKFEKTRYISALINKYSKLFTKL